MSKPNDVFVFPVSSAQRRLWFLEQFEAGSAAYNVPAAVRLEGRLDVDALGRSLNEIVERHESLRTSLEAMDGEPVQVVSPEAAIELPLVDLSHLAGEAGRAEATRILREEAGTPVPLDRAPLMRAKLIRLEATAHVLVVVMHHAVTDGWSMGVFVRELAALYRAFVERKPSPLPALDLQYADYTIWQNEELTEAALAGPLAYWKQKLHGAPTAIELPTARPRPPMQSHDGGWLPVELSAELTRKLKDLARAEGATLFMVLLAGLGVLLSRYSGQKDVLIGSPVAGRNRAELEGLIGFFVNMLVLRTSTAGDPSFREMIGRAKRTVLEAEAHQDVPFERLVHELQPERDTSRSPLFQVMLALQNAPMPPLELPNLSVERIETHSGTAKFDISLELTEQDGALVGGFEYATALFDESTAARMVEHLATLLNRVVAEPAEPVSRLPILSERELRQVIVGWNNTSASFPTEACIHELFEEQARIAPNAIAVECDGDRLRYGELDELAEGVAAALRAEGAGPGVLVGICVERSARLLAAVLGVLKSGAAYIPLDPSYPAERLAFMLADSRAPVVVTERALVARLASTTARPFCLEDLGTPKAGGDARPAASTDLAYVIYTSGSTGRPKGVALEHRSVVNFLCSMRREPGIEARDVLLAVTSLSFDIAVLELLLPICVGARVVIATRSAIADGRELLALMSRSGATMMQATPASWQMLLEAEWTRERTPSLRKVLCGGEAMTPTLARALLERSDEVWNMYGPTETTVWSSVCRINEAGSDRISIGRPIANTAMYVLDGHLCPMPVGVPGELWIGGEGLARGYLERPELTEERFRPDPWRGPGARMYRTGDLARWLPDGRLECLGRTDHQVKVRGFRIELGEIEAVLSEHPGVQQAACAVRQVAGEPALVAYVVLRESEPDAGADGLLTHLRQRLPAYMVPASIVHLDALPLTPNGKLDRKALPAPASEATRSSAAGSDPPRSETETGLAALWCDLLGVTSVGASDDFFALGGHSLRLAHLAALVRQRFGIDVPLRLAYERSTLRQLAEAIDSLRHGSAAPEVSLSERALLERDAVLDPDIVPQQAQARPSSRAERGEILLTGATGFLGAYLLAGLLRRTEDRVVCLVRARDEADALRRLEDNLARFGLGTAPPGRLVPLVGDLAAPRLGLDEQTIAALSESVGLVIHNGALVHHLQPYEALRAANVLATKEVLRFVAKGREKVLHHVSTMSVFPDVHGAGLSFDEDDLPASAVGLETGYARSKWVAERLLRQARTRGLPVVVHRPGFVTGDPRTGYWPDDFLSSFLRGCVQLGAAPDFVGTLAWAPVDFVSEALLELALEHDAVGKTFHLIAPGAGSSFGDVIQSLRAFGYPVEELAYGAWLTQLRAAVQAGASNDLAPFVPLLPAEVAVGPSGRSVLPMPELRTDKTRRELGPLPCPRLDPELLAVYLAVFVGAGKLPVPTRGVQPLHVGGP